MEYVDAGGWERRLETGDWRRGERREAGGGYGDRGTETGDWVAVARGTVHSTSLGSTGHLSG